MLEIFLASCLIGEIKDSAETLNAIRILYEANRTAAKTGDFEFLYSIGSSDAIPAAVQNWNTRYTAKCSLAFQGGRLIYARMFSDDDVLKARNKTGHNSYSTLVQNVETVSDGTKTLIVNKDLNNDGVVYHSSYTTLGVEPFFANLLFPLSVGNPNPLAHDLGRDLRLALEDQSKFAIHIKNELMDQVATIRIDLETEKSLRTYWIDMEHGAVPLKIRDESKSNVGHFLEIINSELKLVAGISWFPHRMLVSGSNRKVQEVVVTRSRLNDPLPPGRFVLKTASPTAVTEAVPGGVVRYSPRQNWNLASLPSNHNSREATLFPVAQVPPVAEPVMEGPRSGHLNRIVSVTLALVMAVVMAIVISRIKRA